ncbi:hypothetical protein [Paenibacillus dendritiformis]|uniref:hypothetical protein n=1 Tax=Paenibacillus dendritiformis TaxID=130049 RepID=UPI00387E0739
MNKKDLIMNHQARRYELSEKLLKATADELKNITQWTEYKNAISATEKLEEFEKRELK